MLITGDVYNLMTNNSQVGNQWLNTLGPIIRSKPFVVAAATIWPPKLADTPFRALGLAAASSALFWA